MPEGRPDISAEMRRAVLVEAGHRCAIPTCRQHPVDIDHIDDWAKVKEHEFDNLIALCPTCHRRKGNGPNQIDRKSLKQYKANLSLANSRYSEYERRLIDYLARQPHRDLIQVPGGMEVMVHYLVVDEFLEETDIKSSKLVLTDEDEGRSTFTDGTPIEFPDTVIYRLTETGRTFVDRWAAAPPLDGGSVE